MDHVRKYLVCLKCDCHLNMMMTTHIFSQSVLEAIKLVVLVCTREKCLKCSPTQPASRCETWVGLLLLGWKRYTLWYSVTPPRLVQKGRLRGFQSWSTLAASRYFPI